MNLFDSSDDRFNHPIMQAFILVLASLGVFQALFLSVYLLTLKKGKALANIFLAVILIGLSVRIGKSIFNHYLDIAPWQRNLGLSGILLVGPSLWCYLGTLTSRINKINGQVLRHYIPAALMVLLCWLIPNDFSLSALISYLFVMAHMLVYLLVSERQRRVLGDPSIDPALAGWLSKLHIGLGIIWCYYMAVLLRFDHFYIGGAITYSVLIYVMCYFLLHRQDVSSQRYQNSTLDVDESQQLMEKIQALFLEEKIYLDNKLNLETVAARVAHSSRGVSQVINEQQQLNFSEYVKRHRLEHAKRLLQQPSDKPKKILAIALESGFGNVTSFNTAFKSLMDMTPSQYREQFNQP